MVICTPHFSCLGCKDQRRCLANNIPVITFEVNKPIQPDRQLPTASRGDKNDRRQKSYVAAQIKSRRWRRQCLHLDVHSKPAAYLSAQGIALHGGSAAQEREYPLGTGARQATMSTVNTLIVVICPHSLTVPPALMSALSLSLSLSVCCCVFIAWRSCVSSARHQRALPDDTRRQMHVPTKQFNDKTVLNDIQLTLRYSCTCSTFSFSSRIRNFSVSDSTEPGPPSDPDRSLCYIA